MVAITATMLTDTQRCARTRKARRPNPAVYRLSTLLAIAPQITTSKKGTRYQPGRIFGRFAIGLDISTSVASTVPIKEPKTAATPTPSALIRAMRFQLVLVGK